MDLFEIYLNNNSPWINRALTDKSYKNEFMRTNHKPYDGDTNEDLATYGDAVIKLCYLELMLDKESKLSIEKAKIESDEYLVDVIARHYNMLEFIKTDSENKEMKKTYDFIKPAKTSGGNKKDSQNKFIATAVEAMIGAIYKEEKDLKPIIELLDSWRKF
jgi:dsRNA-specific ribonuclease